MKPIIYVIPFTVLAIILGQRADSDVAALAIGSFIGLLAGALIALIYAIARDQRAAANRAAVMQPRRAPADPAPYIDGDWRELAPAPGPGPQRPAPSDQIAAPITRAIVIRR